ncbi:MAG: protein kinase [Bryobacterales bacterium]|nr:protein kinase [Bryobacterales bacterium]
MNPRGDGQERVRRVKEIFSEAVEASPSQRPELLDRLCIGEHSIRAEVEELLSLGGKIGDAFVSAASPYSARYGPGQTVGGRYRILRFLASGGMGEVYAAEDGESGSPVAIKFIRMDGLDTPARARLVREVRMASQIHHPNVCRMYGLGQHGNEHFCVMELLEGETLGARLAAAGRLSAEVTLGIARQLCQGLAAAHQAGVVHRDLKPGNIFLAGDRTVIIDFGLAAALPGARDVSASLTSAGAVVGTLAYMAPEQLEGNETGRASDIYSAGVVLYEMITGLRPHDAKSPLRLAAQKSRERDLAPSLRAADVPAVWHEAIARCLKQRPEDRFRGAEELLALLDRGKPTTSFVVQQWKGPVAASALAVMIALTGAFGWLLWTSDRMPAPAVWQLYLEGQAAMNGSAPYRAVKLFEQAVQRDPGFLKARAARAVAYVDLDLMDKARQAMLEATASADSRIVLGSTERHTLHAARAAVMRDHSAAAERYQRLAYSTTGVERSNALLSAARSLEAGAKLQEAERTLQLVLTEDPSHASARIRFAMLLRRKRQFEQAITELSKAEAALQKSGNPEGLADLILARAMIPDSDPEEAREQLKRVLAIAKETGNRYHEISARLRMAYIAQRLRDYEGAIEIAREASRQASREGMSVIAARALGDLGHSFTYVKKWAEGEALLREAVELAERAGSEAIQAVNRIRWGECLGSLGRYEERLLAVEAAVPWYRQQGQQDTLPLILVRYGDALGMDLKRWADARKTYEEALAVAERHENPLFQTMALQRLAMFTALREPSASAKYIERAVVHARSLRHAQFFFQAGWQRESVGDYKGAARWYEEGERLRLTYPPGIDRDTFGTFAKWRYASGAFYRGECDAGLRIAAQLRPPGLSLAEESSVHLLRACRKGAGPSDIRQSLQAHVELLSRQTHRPHRVPLALGAGRLAALLKDWQSVRAHATEALTIAKENGLRMYEMEALLLLRLAAHGFREGPKVATLTSEVLNVSGRLGFDPADRFGGRWDLLSLWQAVR